MNAEDTSCQNSERNRLISGASRRESRKRKRRFVFLALAISASVLFLLGLLLGLVLGITAVLHRLPRDPYDRAIVLLERNPLIDGHNDLPEQLRLHFRNQLQHIDLSQNSSGMFESAWDTDIPRLRAGKVGAQFWSAYVGCDSQYMDATRIFIDQMDVIKLMVRNYSSTFMFATSVADIEEAFDKGRIASLIGVEGGHAIDSSLATLRQIYELGGRYMTLTHSCDTPWAHSSTDNGTEGLTDFGKDVVREMNRLGMMVDLSHVNNYTMMDALETSIAPVIFSHSSAYSLCNCSRNVPDNVLKKLKDNGGIVMTTFVPHFIDCGNASNATLSDVADHIDYLRSVVGVDHVGIGSDFDGTDSVPVGLEDVSKFPDLFAELIKRKYSDSDIIKIARTNLLRVFKGVEKVRDQHKSDFPDNTLIEPQPNQTCRPDF